MDTLVILGATGSIGQSTIDVVKRHPKRYQVLALTANAQYSQLLDDALACHASIAVLHDESVYESACAYAKHIGFTGEIAFGESAAIAAVQHASVTKVMAAIVGGAGLKTSMAAVQAGKTLLLANKESLVMSGALLMDAAAQSGATILPIDSEHNAIFQCLPKEFAYGDLIQSGIHKVLLTGSGGPFLTRSLDSFDTITPEQACAHPNWDMGQKISVDSATMMNKGLEFIEAKWLFGLSNDDIQIVLHPQSVIHSMVQYCDGSVIAQMGNPDMRTPIAHALAYPERVDSGVAPLDFSQLNDFTFATPCQERYPNLYLTLAAAEQGQTACTFINASNEVAVAAFLHHEIGFTDITRINEQVLAKAPHSFAHSLDEVIALDEQARSLATEAVQRLTKC